MRRSWIWVGWLLLFTNLAMAGVVFEVETKEAGRDPIQTKASVHDGNLKMEIPSSYSANSGDVIFRGDRREMVVVDHENKSYMVIDAEMIRSVAGQVNQVMSKMEEALKNVPDSQKAAIEKMMKERMPQQTKPAGPKETVTKTGDRTKVNGYPCRKYMVSRDGKKVRELWVTDWNNVEGGADAKDAFLEMAGFFEEMMESFGKFGGGASMKHNMFAQIKETNGFPVRTLEFNEGGELERESNLRSSRKVSLVPSDFEPPSGYQRRTMNGMH